MEYTISNETLAEFSQLVKHTLSCNRYKKLFIIASIICVISIVLNIYLYQKVKRASLYQNSYLNEPTESCIL